MKGSLGSAWALRGLLESNVIGRSGLRQWEYGYVCGVRVMDCMVAEAKHRGCRGLASTQRFVMDQMPTP